MYDTASDSTSRTVSVGRSRTGHVNGTSDHPGVSANAPWTGVVALVMQRVRMAIQKGADIFECMHMVIVCIYVRCVGV